MSAIKDEEKSVGSPSEDSAAEPEVPEEETLDVNLGPKSHISLLDQHSELKRKAEGEYCNFLTSSKFEPRHEKTNILRAVQSQKMARGLKFGIKKEEERYYLCSENKGADQLRGYREGNHEADLRLKLICVFVFAYAKRWFSHDAAHLFQLSKI